MAKQIKARKHALRKMITSAVLAGTAITTIGGAMGSVKSVYALPKIEEEVSTGLNKIIAERRINNMD